MLRGYNEKVFFAVTHNKVDKIMMINYQSNKQNEDEMNVQEVYEIENSKLV